MRPPALRGGRARRRHPLADHGRRLRRPRSLNAPRPRAVHLDAQVDAVQQRAGQLAEIASLGRRGADAVLRIRRRARARVGRQHQLEARRIARHAVAAREPNLAVLQRCSQCLQRADPDLGALVEEQHAAVRTADRARSGHPRAAADQRGDGRRVVRRDERRPGDQRRIARQQARDRVDRRHLQRLSLRQRRQQSRKALRQHRFADTGRTGQHQVVGTRGGHLDGVPRVRSGPTTSARSAAGSGADGWVVDPVVEPRLARQPGLQLPQRAHAPHLDAVDQAGLGAGCRPAPTTAGQPSPLGRQHRRQHPLDRAHPPVEREFAQQHGLFEPRPRLLAARPTAPRRPAPGRKPSPSSAASPVRAPASAATSASSLPQLVIAARTRSRDSCKAASGSPTRCTPGRPEVMSASISTISPSSPRTATENALPSAISRPPCRWVISGVGRRPMRTPTTSMRTAAQLPSLPASHNPASLRSRRTLSGVTACATPPNRSLVRVFTSTNTTVRVRIVGSDHIQLAVAAAPVAGQHPQPAARSGARPPVAPPARRSRRGSTWSCRHCADCGGQFGLPRGRSSTVAAPSTICRLFRH